MNLYRSNRQMVGHLVNSFVALAELLLLLRVILKFAVAETDASFVQWVFRVTDPLLQPFRSVFESVNEAGAGGSWIIDWPALMAMAVYAAAGYVLISLVARSTPPGANGRK